MFTALFSVALLFVAAIAAPLNGGSQFVERQETVSNVVCTSDTYVPSYFIPTVTLLASFILFTTCTHEVANKFFLSPR